MITNKIKHTLKCALVSVLWLLVLYGNTSKEFIHQFCGHKDTIHTGNYSKELSLEETHHHCEWLTYSVTDFDGGFTIPFLTTFLPEHTSFCDCFHRSHSAAKIERTALRGPPGCFV